MPITLILISNGLLHQWVGPTMWNGGTTIPPTPRTSATGPLPLIVILPVPRRQELTPGMCGLLMVSIIQVGVRHSHLPSVPVQMRFSLIVLQLQMNWDRQALAMAARLLLNMLRRMPTRIYSCPVILFGYTYITPTNTQPTKQLISNGWSQTRLGVLCQKCLKPLWTPRIMRITVGTGIVPMPSQMTLFVEHTLSLERSPTIA